MFENFQKLNFRLGVASGCVAALAAMALLPVTGGDARAELINRSTPNLAYGRSANTVRTRPGEYDQIGFTTGPIDFFPRVEVSGLYDDNIFAEQGADARGDEILVISPELEIITDWENHEIALFFGGEFGIYDTYSSEDYENYTAEGRFRLDITEATNAILEVGYDRGHQRRGDPEDVSGLDPTVFESLKAGVQINQSLGNLQLSFGGSYLRYDFDDVRSSLGGFINNDDRDRDIFNIAARAAYEFSPGYSVFVEVIYNWRRFDEIVDDFGFMRDSEGYEIDAGVQFEITDLIYGYIFGGYSWQSPDDPFFENYSGVSFGASIDWNVTQLTTIGLRAERNVEDTVFFAASGFFADRAALTVDHELLENLIITIYGEIGQDDYKGIDRNDFRYGFGVEATWKINNYVHARLAYSHDARETDYPGLVDFNRNLIALGVTLQY